MVKTPLMPIGICWNLMACSIQEFDLFEREQPSNRPEVLPELFLVSRTNHHICYCRAT